jgi:hypothetical protein
MSEIVNNSEIKSKTCCKCKEIRPLAEFCKDKHQKDGLHGRCCACRKLPPERKESSFVIDTRNGWKICKKCNEKEELDNFFFNERDNIYFGSCKTCRGTIEKQKKLAERSEIWKERIRIRELVRVYEFEGKLYKHCTKCGQTKETSEFHSHRGCKDNLEKICKPCANTYVREYCHKRPEWKKMINKKVKEKLFAKPGYRELCNQRKREFAKTEYGKVATRKWRENRKIVIASNPVSQEKIRAGRQAYRANPINKERRNSQSRERYENDLNHKILIALRNRMTHAIAKGTKSQHTMELTGCTMEFLLKHLESQFVEGMNWNNYGKGEGKWSIEHIVCCALFSLSLPNHQKACFHYSNLKPMWDLLNSSKQDKISDGRSARFISENDKKAELIKLGFGYLFEENQTLTAQDL